MAGLGLRQRELSERSHVSQAIVREIQNDTVRRRRGDRTLEALSLALDWHPQHLSAVLGGLRPPAAGDPVNRVEDEIPARLTAIERHLRAITNRLDDISHRLAREADRDGDA